VTKSPSVELVNSSSIQQSNLQRCANNKTCSQSIVNNCAPPHFCSVNPQTYELGTAVENITRVLPIVANQQTVGEVVIPPNTLPGNSIIHISPIAFENITLQTPMVKQECVGSKLVNVSNGTSVTSSQVQSPGFDISCSCDSSHFSHPVILRFYAFAPPQDISSFCVGFKQTNSSTPYQCLPAQVMAISTNTTVNFNGTTEKLYIIQVETMHFTSFAVFLSPNMFNTSCGGFSFYLPELITASTVWCCCFLFAFAVIYIRPLHLLVLGLGVHDDWKKVEKMLKRQESEIQFQLTPRGTALE